MAQTVGSTKQAGNKQQNDWHSSNLHNLWDNSKQRIILLIVDLAVIFGFLLVLSIISPFFNGINVLITLTISFPLIILGIVYFYRSSSQLLAEVYLSKHLSWVKMDIANLIQLSKIEDEERNEDWDNQIEKNRHFLQQDISKARVILKEYIDYSEIVLPPIYNYELDRLQKSIDVFFNCSSEVLFPCAHTFSDSETFEKMQAEYWDSSEIPFLHPISMQEVKEIEAEVIEENKKKDFPDPRIARICEYNIQAFDEFIEYLGRVLYARVRPHAILRYRHPINLLELSRFFTYWNVVLASCRNTEEIYPKVKKDVIEYYKTMSSNERLQKKRITSLKDSILLLIVGGIISAFITYVMGSVGIV